MYVRNFNFPVLLEAVLTVQYPFLICYVFCILWLWIVDNRFFDSADSYLVGRQLPFAVSRSNPPFSWWFVNIILTDIASIPSVFTDTGFKCRFPPTIFSNLALTTAIKTTHDCLYIEAGNVSGFKYLPIVWTYLLSLLHLKVANWLQRVIYPSLKE